MRLVDTKVNVATWLTVSHAIVAASVKAVLAAQPTVTLTSAGVVTPSDILLIVPAVAGAMVSVPVPVGAIEIVALAGFMLNAPSNVKLTPPPAPHCKHDALELVRNAPPLEPEASKNGPTNLVFAVIVVPVTAAAVVAPTVAPLIVPPVMATALAAWVDIVPRPVMSVLGMVADAVITPVPLPLT